MIIKVLVELSNRNIDKTFSYLVPNNLIDKIKIGVRVKVPFNNRVLEGFIISINDKNVEHDLKEIISIIDDEVILIDELLLLGKYISDSTLSTLISSYQVMLPKALKARNKSKVNIATSTYIEFNNEVKINKLSNKQQEIIDLVLSNNMLYRDLKKVNSSVDTLIKKDILKKVVKEQYRLNTSDVDEKKEFTLTTDQIKVIKEVVNNLNNNNTYLLHGVTGSGKTLVYMEIIDKVIKNNQTAIILVPEISLTPQMVYRLKSRFKSDIAILHSALSDGERYDEYRKISRGEVHIVVGTRSAIFAPLKNIGIIIIDEEHTTSYKQDNMPRYHAIDVAKYRANYHNCPLILGSATPTLESYARAKKNVYHLLELPKRINGNLPTVLVVDMMEDKTSSSCFGKTLIKYMNDTLERGEQVILFLNKRGYSSIITCRNCGNTMKCPHCDISLTYHKTNDMLRCHYCGYATPKIGICPTCKSNGIMELGTGTERIEEELHSLFKNYKIARMDFDTTTKKGSHEKIINDFQSHQYDILLGTQMIAKGLDFDNVTLVGVINADISLSIPDFRSSEYTFQLLSQVAGRSGRGTKKGHVIIQTYNKDHYAINYAKNSDYLGFYNQEMVIRKELKYPPYYYLIYIKIKSKDYNILSIESNKISNILRNKLLQTIVLGPSICTPFKINSIYRFGIILKYRDTGNINEVLKDLIDHYKSNSKIQIDIDFNPNYF